MENSCFGYVPDSGGFSNVRGDELPKGLVIGPTLGTVCALIWMYMAMVIFGTTVVSSLSCHLDTKTQKSHKLKKIKCHIQKFFNKLGNIYL